MRIGRGTLNWPRDALRWRLTTTIVFLFVRWSSVLIPQRRLHPAAPPRSKPEARPLPVATIDTQPLDCEVDTNPDTNITVSENREGGVSNRGTLRRDKDYYFTDGSVVLRVEDTLFKIHASHLEAHSDAFENMFATISPDDGKEPLAEGLCDEAPVVVLDIKTSQFRNSLKMFYCPASDDFFANLQICEGNDEDAWANFRFYLDVASLSQRFELPGMEEWAKSGLNRLLHASNVAPHSEEDADNSFLDALEYSKTQTISMARDVRNLFQCRWYYYDWKDYPMENFALFFNTLGLSQRDLFMFGFLFVFILSFHWGNWDTTLFTKTNRMALYSARVRLTPIPLELKQNLHSPPFSKPTSANDFLNALWSGPANKDCSHKCRNNTFQGWQDQSNDSYYGQMPGEGLDEIRALGSLPKSGGYSQKTSAPINVPKIAPNMSFNSSTKT